MLYVGHVYRNESGERVKCVCRTDSGGGTTFKMRVLDSYEFDYTVTATGVAATPGKSIPYLAPIGSQEREPSPPEPVKSQDDPVNAPSHYTQHGIETIDAIEGSMSEECFKGFLMGNVIKYVTRYEHKGKPVEDLNKAIYYLTRLRDTVEKRV